jgi:hypothetical protein
MNINLEFLLNYWPTMQPEHQIHGKLRLDLKLTFIFKVKLLIKGNDGR